MNFRHGDKIEMNIEDPNHSLGRALVEGVLIYDCGGAYIVHNDRRFNGATPSRNEMPRDYDYSWSLNVNEDVMCQMEAGGGRCDWTDLQMLSRKSSHHGSILKFRMT